MNKQHEKIEKYNLDSELALYEEVSEANETLEAISSKIDDVVTELKKPEKEYPKIQDVRVLNPTKVEIPNEIDIKKPSWFSLEPLFQAIGLYIGSAVDELKAFTFKVQVEGEKEEYGKVTLVDERGKPLKIMEAIMSSRTQKQDDVKYFQSFPDSMVVTDKNGVPLGTLSGSSANGSRTLTSANTWYSVPSTVPTSPYILVATVENSVGTVRFGFDNTGTPSATNGNQAPSQLTVRLAANQVIYYASSSANDQVNWTIKII